MKKFVLLFCMTVAVFTAQAQKERGFGGKAEIVYGYEVSDQNSALGINLMPGYHFNPHWFAGLGVGFQQIMDTRTSNTGTISLVPVFVHGQWNITKDTKWTPFIGAKTGYAIGSKTLSETWDGPVSDVECKAQGRWMSGVEAGVKYAVASSAIYASLYYEYIGMKHSALSNIHVNIDYATSGNQMIGLKVGWEF